MGECFSFIVLHVAGAKVMAPFEPYMTEAVLADLIIHEQEEYFLIEVTSEAAIERIERDEEKIITRLFERGEDVLASELDRPSTGSSIQSLERYTSLEHEASEPSSLDELFALEVEQTPRAAVIANVASTIQSSNPWSDRPGTNNWHPAPSARQTDEFDRLHTERLKERVRALEAVRSEQE